MNKNRENSCRSPTGFHKPYRVLFVTHHRPWPANYGAAIRVLAQLQALEAIAQVDLVILGDLGALRNDPFYQQERLVTELPWSMGVQSPILRALADRRQDGGYWLSTYIPGFTRLLRAPVRIRTAFRAIVENGYDALYMIRPETYWYLLPQGWHPIVDVDDVQSLHVSETLRGSTGGLGRLKSLALRIRLANLRRAEEALFSQCAAGLVCSDEDAEKLGHASVVVLPNPIPEHGQALKPIAEGESERIAFVGALKYRPNIEAVRFFAQEVLPLIRDQIPTARLTVIGAYRDTDCASLREGAGIDLLGFVESIQGALEPAALVIAPLKEGMGSRIKILEALSYGKPVVATTIGAHGIRLGAEDGLFREDDPQRMAAICLDLMRDPIKRLHLGGRAKQRVYETYGQDAFIARVRDILNRAACTREAH